MHEDVHASEQKQGPAQEEQVCRDVGAVFEDEQEAESAREREDGPPEAPAPGPVLLMVASVLPPSLANTGLDGVAAGKKSAKTAAQTSTTSGGSVQKTPDTVDSL